MSQSYQHGDYNRGGMIAFAFSMAITLAFFVYVAFVHQGVDLKELQQEQPQTEQPAQDQETQEQPAQEQPQEENSEATAE